MSEELEMSSEREPVMSEEQEMSPEREPVMSEEQEMSPEREPVMSVEVMMGAELGCSRPMMECLCRRSMSMTSVGGSLAAETIRSFPSSRTSMPAARAASRARKALTAGCSTPACPKQRG